MSLRQVSLRRVECDFDGCENATDVTSSDSISARFEAAALGWGYAAPRGKGAARRYDYCPTHKAADS